MADKKISELSVATTPLSGSELIPLVQGGVNKRIPASALIVTGPQGPQGPAGPMGPQGPAGQAATLVPATATTLGAIKVGSNLTITDDGTLSATGGGGGGGVTPDISMTATVDGTSGTPAVTVTKSGPLDAPTFNLAFTGIAGAQGAQGPQGPQGPQGDPAVLPAATDTTLGGIKVGSGLAVTPDGTLSATGGGGGTAGVSSFNGRTGAVASQSGDYTAEMVGLGNVDNTSDANKPISTATQAALDEKANTADLATVATTGSYNDLTDQPAIPPAFTLSPATASTLGGVKVGGGLSVAADGTLSATGGGGGASSLDDLSDVGLSTSPPAGALLGFDGTAWKDVELTGGGATSVSQTANGLQVYSSPYNLPNASATELGGVKVGAGLQIDGSGVLSATGGGGTGSLTEFEGLTGVKNMLDVGSYPYIGVNNDGSLRIPAAGSNGATLTITRDFYLADYGLAQGDVVVVTGIPSGCALKHACYSAQNVAASLSSDPDTWTIRAEEATEGRIVLTLDVPGYFAGANAKIMFRKEGIASSEFQPFALGNAALTSSLRYLTEQLGCKNLLPAYQSADGFTVAADGGITVPIYASSDKRFVIASGLIDNGTVKAGQQYYLSGIDATNSSQTIGTSLTFEYTLGGATQTVTAALATDTLVDIPAGATGGNVVLTRLGFDGNHNTKTVYPMLRDARMADSTYQKPAAFPYSSLASLSDVSTANTAEGNILTFNGTAWTNGTLTGNNGVTVSRNGANYTLAGDAAWAKTQAIAAPLTGLNTSLTGTVTTSDTVLSAIGKLLPPRLVGSSSGTTYREHIASLMPHVQKTPRQVIYGYLLDQGGSTVFRIASRWDAGIVFYCPCKLGITEIIIFIPSSSGNVADAFVKSRAIGAAQFTDVTDNSYGSVMNLYL